MNGVTAFEDLTIGEVEEISATCLGGRSFSDDKVDPLMLSAAIMWVHSRKEVPTTWEEFKQRTSMRDIRAFTEDLETAELLNPTNVPNVLAT